MDYTTLITSEHADKPLFVAWVAALTQGLVDYQAATALGLTIDSSVDASVDAPVDQPLVSYTFGALPSLIDLDTAQGAQLDAIGAWIGFARTLDVSTLGFVTLSDGDYRTLLYAKIAANHWDGSMSGLQSILAQILPGTGIQLFAVDNMDMTMTIYVGGGTLSPTQLAMLGGDLLVPRPEGVKITGVNILTGPLFGLDFETALISGLDVGAFPAYG